MKKRTYKTSEYRRKNSSYYNNYDNYYNDYSDYGDYRSYNRTSVAYDTYPPYYGDVGSLDIDYEYRRSVARAKMMAKKERIFHKTRLILSVLIIFGGCILMMCSYTSLHSQRIRNVELKDELIQIQNKNATILADMSADLSVDYIRSEAVNRLGMVEPQDYQKVYINVDEQSYTVSYSGQDAEKEEGFSLSGLMKFLKGE